MSKIGFRIETSPGPAVSAQALAEYATVGSAQISDCMARLYGVVGLSPRHKPGGPRMVGTAVTVKTRPGDNLMIHKAISMAGPGDVIVVDGAGDLTNALVGELMSMQAQARGIAGFVIDGAIRDADTFAQQDFACFARGVSHKGPYKDGPGEINVAISVGGQVVHAGDVVVGDADGVVFIEAARAADVLQWALKKEAAEVDTKRKILAGEGGAKPWIDATIAQKTEAL